jgi:hypothetical protein
MGDMTAMEVQVIEELRTMVEAQQIDIEINAINTRKAEMPAMVARVSGPFDEAEAAYNAAKAAFDKADSENKATGLALEDGKDLLVKLKNRSTEIKTNKEYFAHLKEIEDCEKSISRLEDRALELLEGMDELKSAFDKAAEELDTARAALEEERVKVEASFSDDNARLEELKKQRDELLARLSKTDSAYYIRMVTKYPENGVARAAGGACTGCRMMMPPQAFNNARKGESIVICDNCKRVLYYAGDSD